MSGLGIQPTESIYKDFQAPHTGKELSSLLGFFSYYRIFLPSYSGLTEKINRLRNKRQLGPDEWTPEIDANFQGLKAASFVNVPFLGATLEE